MRHRFAKLVCRWRGHRVRTTRGTLRWKCKCCHKRTLEMTYQERHDAG